MSNLELSAHMTVRPGCLEGFKKQAAECIRLTKEKDTHTLRYDWFLSTDGTECEVREADRPRSRGTPSWPVTSGKSWPLISSSFRPPRAAGCSCSSSLLTSVVESFMSG